MIEQINTLEELHKKYNVITNRKPQKNDLAYIPSLKKVFKIVSVYSTTVTVEVTTGGRVNYPPSRYKLIEPK